MDKSPDNDARTVWQNQKMEARTMSLEELVRRAKEQEARTRRNVLALYLVTAVVAFGFSVGFFRTVDPIRRVGCGVMVLWAVGFAIEGRRRIWPKTVGADANEKDCLEFYRGELLRLRKFSLRSWQLILPVIPGMVLIEWPDLFKMIAKPAAWINQAPFWVLLIVWAILYVSGRRRELSRIQTELTDLDALQKRGA